MAEKKSTDDVLDTIKDELDSFLDSSGQNLEQARLEMADFVESNRDIVEKALEEGSLIALDYTRDALASRTGSTVLGTIKREAKVVQMAFTSVLRTVIKFALA